MDDRLATTIGGLTLRNPVICASGEPVMTEAGIRAALRAGVAGVIAKSVNERPEAAAQLDRADYVELDAAGAPVAHGVSLFNRSGLAQRDPPSGSRRSRRIDRRRRANDGRSLPPRSCWRAPTVPRRSDAWRGKPVFGCSS